VKAQVDPSVVGTSTTQYATYASYQRKTFYANGLFWVFYSDGTNMVYRTSTDGSTWTSPTTVRAAAYGYMFSVWFDGTYLHYAYASTSSIYYRRGTPNSDGTITWSAVEQTVSTTYNKADYPMLSVDSNGYVWIGYRDYTGTYYYPYVVKSGNNDGTWGTTPSGFPYQLSTTSNNYWKVSVIPLTAGKMLAVYVYSSLTIKARKWDGSAWGSEVATASTPYDGRYYSAVAQGDDVHLVFLKNTGYDILYVKYTYNTNSFGTETTLQAGATAYSAPVISIDTSTNDLYVFAATKTTNTPSGWTADHIYYIKYTASSGTWGSWTDWIDESTEVLTGADRLTCFYQAYGNYIGLLYMTKTASPYNVKFAYLSLAAVGEYSFTLSETAHATANLNIQQEHTYTFTGTVIQSSILEYGAEAMQTLTQIITPTETITIWQEHSYNFIETATPTVNLFYTVEGIQEFIETLTQTVTSSGTTYYWMELSYALTETAKPVAMHSYGLEGIFILTQTIVSSGATSYWMELLNVLSETAKSTATHSYGLEGIYTLIQTITPTETRIILQEQLYTFPQTTTLQTTLTYAGELAEAFITNIETITLQETIQYWIQRVELPINWGLVALCASILAFSLASAAIASQKTSESD
jgi:hypothetical protein